MTTENERTEQFERCVEQCADSLYRVAYRLLSNHTLARELVQETYLSAWKNIHQLKDVSKMRGWMFAILRNQQTKILRREKRYTAGSVDHLSHEPTTKLDRKDEVQTALNQLSEEQKLPVLLVAMEGWTVDEAADILNLPRGTVLSRMHRGKQKLKQILMPQEYQSEEFSHD